MLQLPGSYCGRARWLQRPGSPPLEGSGLLAALTPRELLRWTGSELAEPRGGEAKPKTLWERNLSEGNIPRGSNVGPLRYDLWV